MLGVGKTASLQMSESPRVITIWQPASIRFIRLTLHELQNMCTWFTSLYIWRSLYVISKWIVTMGRPWYLKKNNPFPKSIISRIYVGNYPLNIPNTPCLPPPPCRPRFLVYRSFDLFLGTCKCVSQWIKKKVFSWQTVMPGLHSHLGYSSRLLARCEWDEVCTNADIHTLVPVLSITRQDIWDILISFDSGLIHQHVSGSIETRREQVESAEHETNVPFTLLFSPCPVLSRQECKPGIKVWKFWRNCEIFV